MLALAGIADVWVSAGALGSGETLAVRTHRVFVARVLGRALVGVDAALPGPRVPQRTLAGEAPIELTHTSSVALLVALVHV